MMSKKQKTIQKEVSLSGVGLHTGNEVKMTFKPAPENHGFAFKRVDLKGSPTIEAKAEYVINTQRGTNLEKNGVLIQTSEHVLAAAVGLDIDNLLIEIDASEPPIMDGSSKYFVETCSNVKAISCSICLAANILTVPCLENSLSFVIDFKTSALSLDNNFANSSAVSFLKTSFCK